MQPSHVLWLVGGYLAGSIPASYIVARLGGVDLRAVGSGNIGATNLYRAMGWKGAVPAGLFDVAKGAVPVMLAQRYASPEWFALVVGLSAVLGHVFSPFLGFKGGKGVATAAGVFTAIMPWSVLVALGVFLLVVKVSGYVSLGSILAAGALLAATPLVYPGNFLMIGGAAAIFLFILVTHRENVKRLLAGTENRFGRRSRA
jgi:glycerol-3-phosphate acyltransferase PlsY